jgi:hypothetical protein
MTVKRAADHHNLMTSLHPKPKPEKRVKKKRTFSKPRRKVLEGQLEAICKLIVFWRDGAVCVERGIDGVRCGGGLQWGHYIPRKQSSWLKYHLGNTFAQCRNHNNLHDKGSQTMAAWFGKTFGAKAQLALENERNFARSQNLKHTIPQLETMLAHYDELYQNRYFVELDTESQIEAGYYGEVIKEAHDEI